jgi:hypothetical protein
MRPVFFLLVASLACVSNVRAQRSLDLTGTPAHALTEPFTHVAGVRALPGRRAIVTDQMERRVFLVDLPADDHRQIGREGDGPGEYRYPLLPLAGTDGSTWILDAGLRRVLVISPTGRFEPSLAAPYGAVTGGLSAARGTDRTGRIYFEGNSFNAETGRFSDSVAVVRWKPQPPTVAVLGRVWSGGRVRLERAGGVASVARAITPFPAVDAWVVLPDGRVAIVQQHPHRLRFLDETGTVSETADLPFPAVAVTAAERNAYRAREAGARMVAVGGGAAQRRSPTADSEFPQAMPAFIAASVLASPEGEIWIGRSFSSRARTRWYDVFDSGGRLVATATLRTDCAVVGFGEGVIYVARTDPDDHLVHLELYTR